MPDPIRPFLASLDSAALIELIVAEADRDDALAERLRLVAAMAAWRRRSAATFDSGS